VLATGGGVTAIIGARVSIVTIHRNTVGTNALAADLTHGTGIKVTTGKSTVIGYHGTAAYCGVAASRQTEGIVALGRGANH